MVFSSDSLSEAKILSRLSSKTHPTIQCGCSPFTTTAAPESHRVSGALDYIAQADFLFRDKTGKSHAVSGLVRFFHMSGLLFIGSYHHVDLPCKAAAV